MIRLLLLVKKAELQNLTVPKMFSDTASKLPNKIMFYFNVRFMLMSKQFYFSNQVLFVRMRPGHFVKLRTTLIVLQTTFCL